MTHDDFKALLARSRMLGEDMTRLTNLGLSRLSLAEKSALIKYQIGAVTPIYIALVEPENQYLLDRAGYTILFHRPRQLPVRVNTFLHGQLVHDQYREVLFKLKALTATTLGDVARITTK